MTATARTDVTPEMNKLLGFKTNLPHSEIMAILESSEEVKTEQQVSIQSLIMCFKQDFVERMTSGIKCVLSGDTKPILSSKYLGKRTWSEKIDIENLSDPSPVRAIDTSELNAVERAFYKTPRSPNFLIYTDK